ncbi:ERAD-associated E3 ubiquitin-protein ligase HRD1-like [Vigna unguiculata]|uniref:RING-type E3 ubiquitin transferase n=1 Tax=Vigna unguiculata TaxID=3917 RepID=A0A4D6NVF2_VIGUN|nr:ERAD-associated E3 ubiquitin-protein ligase HRD1-like [Vigna unguiculata]QCE16694.1 E3 ubiquitin-protein ligase [Vigna unguiculata]
MADVEGIIFQCHCHVQTEEDGAKVKFSDMLRIDVTISVQFIHYSHGIETSTLLKSSIPISCENFILNNEDFVRSLTSDPRCSHYFVPEMVDLTSETIVNMSVEILEFCCDSESVDSERHELPLNLDIIVDVLQDGESAEEEEEIEQNTTQIPASEEAINSLKTFTNSSILRMKIEKCGICMENFPFKEDEESVKLSSMPCDHVFHHQCIVQWLHRSHTCPLCRYPMPI